MNNIVLALKHIAQYLQTQLEKDKYYLNYKSTVDPEEFERKIPEIYLFTMPSSAIIDGYPSRCPAIVLTLDGRDDSSYLITAHLCVSCASISEQEIARPNKDNPNYTVGTGEGYDTASDNDLIIMSILFTDQITNYLMNCTEMSLSQISPEYQSADLDEFPYAVSSVSFRLLVNKEHIGQNPYGSYY